jgi:lipoyl(octanoyl) transferase
MRSMAVHGLGTVAYDAALALQERLLLARVRGEVGDTVLVLEHPPTITLGRGANARNVLADPDTLRARGVALVETGRGGDVTFHGPGQLVAYPILDLKPDRCDVRRYVRDLGRVMIGLARRAGLGAGMLEGDAKLIGVWVDLDEPASWPEGLAAGDVGPRRVAKLGAIGVRISRWVSMHGFAFNVATRLEDFRLIVPCGITDRGVTSVQDAGGRVLTAREWVSACAEEFARVFDADARVAGAEETGRLWGVGRGTEEGVELRGRGVDRSSHSG